MCVCVMYSSGQNIVNVPFPYRFRATVRAFPFNVFFLRFHTVSAFSRTTHVSIEMAVKRSERTSSGTHSCENATGHAAT